MQTIEDNLQQLRAMANACGQTATLAKMSGNPGGELADVIAVLAGAIETVGTLCANTLEQLHLQNAVHADTDAMLKRGEAAHTNIGSMLAIHTALAAEHEALVAWRATAPDWVRVEGGMPYLAYLDLHAETLAVQMQSIEARLQQLGLHSTVESAIAAMEQL
jgi:hypothetical protein